MVKGERLCCIPDLFYMVSVHRSLLECSRKVAGRPKALGLQSLFLSPEGYFHYNNSKITR